MAPRGTWCACARLTNVSLPRSSPTSTPKGVGVWLHDSCLHPRPDPGRRCVDKCPGGAWEPSTILYFPSHSPPPPFIKTGFNVVFTATLLPFYTAALLPVLPDKQPSPLVVRTSSLSSHPPLANSFPPSPPIVWCRAGGHLSHGLHLAHDGSLLGPVLRLPGAIFGVRGHLHLLQPGGHDRRRCLCLVALCPGGKHGSTRRRTCRWVGVLCSLSPPKKGSLHLPAHPSTHALYRRSWAFSWSPGCPFSALTTTRLLQAALPPPLPMRPSTRVKAWGSRKKRRRRDALSSSTGRLSWRPRRPPPPPPRPNHPQPQACTKPPRYPPPRSLALAQQGPQPPPPVAGGAKGKSPRRGPAAAGAAASDEPDCTEKWNVPARGAHQ